MNRLSSILFESEYEADYDLDEVLKGGYSKESSNSRSKESSNGKSKVALSNIKALFEGELEKEQLALELEQLKKEWFKPLRKSDLDLEFKILQCGIGCIEKDKEMSDADVQRLMLAVDRLMRG